MLHRDEIEADVARGDPDDLKDTFDALVTWSGVSAMAGVADAADLMDLFKRVCAAMLHCADRLPPDTVRALGRGRGGGVSRPPVTYGEAARSALDAHRTWWPAFSASFPDSGDV